MNTKTLVHKYNKVIPYNKYGVVNMSIFLWEKTQKKQKWQASIIRKILIRNDTIIQRFNDTIK